MMKYSSQSVVSVTIYGGPRLKTAASSIFCCKNGTTSARPTLSPEVAEGPERSTRGMVKGIRLIGNLSNNSYEISAKDIDRMFKALDREIKIARARFAFDAEADGQFFKL